MTLHLQFTPCQSMGYWSPKFNGLPWTYVKRLPSSGIEGIHSDLVGSMHVLLAHICRPSSTPLIQTFLWYFNQSSSAVFVTCMLLTLHVFPKGMKACPRSPCFLGAVMQSAISLYTHPITNVCIIGKASKWVNSLHFELASSM